MPYLTVDGERVFYDVRGPDEAPAYVLVNGLTQYAGMWERYCGALVSAGLRVTTFDLLGQGHSTKPPLFIEMDDQIRVVDALVELLGPGRVFLAGISFGGVIAMRYAIEHGDKLCGLVPMSTFSELSPQLLLIGNALHRALTLGGMGYLQDWFLPMNLSGDWLGANLSRLDAVKRPSYLTNDLYAVQNLMESFLRFDPFTERLGEIRCPTMILNGEYDFLTPRTVHEVLRSRIPDSALVIVPRAYHAFTLEMPDLIADVLARFARQVGEGTFVGGGSVWVGPDRIGGPFERFPEGFDHLRLIPVALGGGP